MPHLEITTLGAFQAKMDGQTLAALRTDKARALLVFLAVEAARPHRREALAEMFWSERSATAARNNLRQELYRLRGALGDRGSDSSYLLVTPDEIQFNPASDHLLDVQLFSDHLVAYHAHHPGGLSRCEHCLNHLRFAVGLYGGNFLAGFSLPGCPQFDWWLLAQQEFYHRQILEALELLGSCYESSADYHQAAVVAQKKIELEPWRESAHRLLMRALALSGQRAEALRQYESCRVILAEEMGIKPSRATTDLYELIRLGDIPELEATLQPMVELGSPPRHTLSASPSAVPFVGFETELAQLEGHLAAALSGRARVAFISGEAGSGKTTLLVEFIHRALGAHGDLLAAVGSCNAQFGYGDPYLPFRQVLHTLTGDLPGASSVAALGEDYAARLWAALPIALKALLEEGPDLVGAWLPLEALPRQAYRLGDKGAGVLAGIEARSRRQVGEASASGSLSAQTGLFDQFTRMLLAISRHYPIILALDDLHWADNGTLSLLFHLARNLGDAPILVLGAYRPEELALDSSGERHPMQSLVNELLAQYGEMRLDLASAAGLDFFNAFLDSKPNKLDLDFRQALFRLTEGQPLFTVEQLRRMQESGGLVQDDDGCWVATGNLDWERIPARVEAVIAERLARPSAECRGILEAASVQGETFSAETLATVLDESEARIIEHLSSELCRQHQLVFAEGLQRLGGTTHSHYRFRHALYQRQLYQNLDPVLRARLHQATGEALERCCAQDVGEIDITDASAPRLALHFEKAGLVEKAVHYHLIAGEQAYRLTANEDAISHYTRALELLESTPESVKKNRQELRILVSLSAALNAARGYANPELGQIFARVGALAAESGEIDLVSQALYLSGTYYYARAEFQRTRDEGNKLMELGKNQSIQSMTDAGNLLLGVSNLSTGNFSQANSYFEHINGKSKSDRVSYSTSPFDRVRLLFPVFSGRILWFLGFPDQALSLSQQLLTEVRGLGYPYMLALILGTSSCVIHTLRSEVGILQEQADELRELSAKQGFSVLQAWGKIFLGKVQVEKGKSAIGLANLKSGLEAYRASGHLEFLTLMQAVQAEALAIAKHYEEGLRVLADALCLANKTGERFYEAELHRLRGDILLADCGDEEKAESFFQVALQLAREQSAKSLELRTATSLARLWARQGKITQASQTLGEVYNWFSEGFDTSDLQLAARLLEELESGNISSNDTYSTLKEREQHLR